jgi:hypothetical protein
MPVERPQMEESSYPRLRKCLQQTPENQYRLASGVPVVSYTLPGGKRQEGKYPLRFELWC